MRRTGGPWLTQDTDGGSTGGPRKQVAGARYGARRMAHLDSEKWPMQGGAIRLKAG